jgi:hypothetical protein
VDLEGAVSTARELVLQRFPDARAAWLAGSVVSGTATPTSDLDVTVLLTGPPAPFRESLAHEGWPVELFVHSAESVRHWLGRDLARRRPTLARLIATGVTLVDVDGSAGPVAARCDEVLAAGPGVLDDASRDALRYGLTDLLDDLAGDPGPPVRTAVAVALWEQAAQLLLGGEGRWWGTGKWLVRELEACDEDGGTAYTRRLHDGMLAAARGETDLLVGAVDEILDRHGGRLWAGYRLSG